MFQSFKKSRYIFFFSISILSVLTFFLTILLLYTSLGLRFFLRSTDFRAFYTGGLMLLNNVTQDFYTLSTQYNWQHKFTPEMSDPKYLMPFVYPPFVAIPMAFIALLPFETAYFVYMLWNIALLAVLCFLIIRICKNVKTITKVALITMCVTFLPILTTIIQGQLSLLLTLALLNIWLSFKAGNKMRCGLWLSLLFVRPHLVIVPIIAFALKRELRVLIGLAIGSSILLMLSYLLVGWSGLKEYITLLTSAFSWGDAYTRHPQMLHSWNGFIHFLFNTNQLRGIIFLLWLLGIILATALLLWAWRGRLIAKTSKFALQWAILVLTMLFTSPHVNFHDLSLLIVPGLLVTFYLTREKHDAKWNRLLTLLLFLGYFSVSFTLVAQTYLRLQISVLFMLLALVLLAWTFNYKK